MKQRIFVILVLLLKIISAENDSVAIPVFKNCAEYGKHIDEELEVGSIVMQVSATVENVVDVDIEYALLSNDRFKIDAKSGQITTNYNFDRDEPRNEKLELITVIASHTQNMLEFLGTCEFEIIIDDINDNSPIFQQTHYQSSVMINSKLNDIIFKVEATDIDEGINSKLTYATDSHTFSIDDNGIIFLEVIVDKKVGDIYNFTVTAYSGKKQTNSLISLTVVSENPSTVTQSSQVTNVQTTVKISSSSNDPNADKDEDNEGETQNNLAKKDETTVKNSLLSNDPNAGKDKENEGENHKTPPQNSQTTNDQTTVKNSLLLNDPDAKADEVNKDQTLTIVNQPIDEASLLPNITDTEGDKINDVFMNETITSDDTKINMKKTIVGFLIKDYNLIAILAIIIIIMINILVCRCCFCRSKRISHDFTSTDNSLYFFGSEKRDSFGMIETKAMNDYEPTPTRHCTRNCTPEPIEDQIYHECAVGLHKDTEVYDHLTYNGITTNPSSTPNDSFYKKPTSFISNRMIFPELHARPSNIPFCQSSNRDLTPDRTSAPCYANIPINVNKYI